MPRTPRYTETQVREAVENSPSYAEALRRLGLRAAGGNYRSLKKLIAYYNISTDHFDPNWVLRGPRTRKTIPLDEILVEHSHYNRGHLKRRLYDTGLKQRQCELCGQGETWLGRAMALILDHINGVATDNRLENLRVVCPNCAMPERRKVPRPPYEQLLAEVSATSYLAVGRKYGVSDNAVRKWIRWYEYQREGEVSAPRDQAA